MKKSRSICSTQATRCRKSNTIAAWVMQGVAIGAKLGKVNGRPRPHTTAIKNNMLIKNVIFQYITNVLAPLLLAKTSLIIIKHFYQDKSNIAILSKHWHSFCASLGNGYLLFWHNILQRR